MNQLKKLIILVILKLVFQFKKLTITEKLIELLHDKFITTQEFNQLISEKFASGLVETNLPNKNNVFNLVKRTDQSYKTDKPKTGNKVN